MARAVELVLRSVGGRLFRRVRYGAACGSCLALVGAAVALAPAASATAATFTWSGKAASPDWSASANWTGAAAPSASGAVALDFPRLSTCGTCYRSMDNLGGVTAESLRIDDGNDYLLEGEALRLGAGGLTASPEDTSSAAGDVFAMPLELTASQTWSIGARGDGKAGEGGVALEEGVNGAGDALKVGLSDNAALILEGDSELGAFTLEGPTSTLMLLEGELNAADGAEVDTAQVPLAGAGRVGALRSSGVLLPLPELEADSATLASTATLGFTIGERGSVPGRDYSVLRASGAVDLQGPSLAVLAVTKGCEPLAKGSTYTILSTTGTLEGSFGNAAEGAKVPIVTAEKCFVKQELKISYVRSGATKSVLGTVVEEDEAPPPVENQPTPYENEGASWNREMVERAAEEESRKYFEEVRRAEEAVKHRQQEEAERQYALEHEPPPAWPAGEPEAEPARGGGHERARMRCHVPALNGDSLAKARRALRKHHCSLGKLRQPDGKRSKRGVKLVVVGQAPKAGRRMRHGAKVSVRLGVGGKRAPARHPHSLRAAASVLRGDGSWRAATFRDWTARPAA